MSCLHRRRRKIAEARRELARTEHELERVQSQWPIVHDIVAAFSKHRDRNHFSESIASIYRGGRA